MSLFVEYLFSVQCFLIVSQDGQADGLKSKIKVRLTVEKKEKKIENKQKSPKQFSFYRTMGGKIIIVQSNLSV